MSVRRFREASKKATTRRDAEKSSVFQQIRQPHGPWLAVPRVSSENRKYVPIQVQEASVICTDSILAIQGATSFDFGILTSSVFNVWLAAVSGRLKSDYRVSAEITYNNFPWPEVSSTIRDKISSAADTVLTTRAIFGDTTLATLYAPISMPPALAEAHQKLDFEILRAYGMRSNATRERTLEELFVRYAKLSGVQLVFEV